MKRVFGYCWTMLVVLALSGSSVAAEEKKPRQRIREQDPSLNNLVFPGDYKTMPDGAMPKIDVSGNGKRPMILIGGHSSRIFDGFIRRNRTRYRMYLITPPGFGGTPARPMPPAGTSYAMRTWTRRLELDALALGDREKIARPVLLGFDNPGTQVALELAIEHPTRFDAVVSISGIPARPLTNRNKLPATAAERADLVDQYWALKWFKTVTRRTWDDNNFSAKFFSRDPPHGRELYTLWNAAPLPVLVRYLCEFWASDFNSRLSELRVPTLALTPGFDEELLADVDLGRSVHMYRDAWAESPKNPKLHIQTIPNAHLAVMDDQPEATDRAIAEFLEKVEESLSH